MKGQDERNEEQRRWRWATCKGKVIIIAIEVKIMRRSEKRDDWEPGTRTEASDSGGDFSSFTSSRLPPSLSLPLFHLLLHTQTEVGMDGRMIAGLSDGEERGGRRSKGREWNCTYGSH